MPWTRPRTTTNGPLSSGLWEYDPSELDWDEDRDLIVRRILTEGSWNTVV